MFNTISWQEFLSTVTVIAGGYYIVYPHFYFTAARSKTSSSKKEPKLIAAEIVEIKRFN